MSNKKRLFCMITLASILLLLFSCNPVPKAEKIPFIPMDGDDVMIDIDTNYADRLMVRFDVVQGAVAYKVTAQGPEGTPTRSIKVNIGRNYNMGRINATVKGLAEDTPYLVTITFTDKYGNELDVTADGTYRTASKGNEAPTTRPATKLNLAWNPTKSAYEAVVEILRLPKLEYRIVVEDKDGNISEHIIGSDETADTLTLDKAPSEIRKITVYNGRKSDAGKVLWGSLPEIMCLPEKIATYDGSLTLKEDNGHFSWNKEEGSSTGRVSLWVQNNDGVFTKLDTTDAGTEGTFTWEDKLPFNTGFYFASDDKTVSNLVAATSGFKAALDIDQQNATLTWKIPEDVSLVYTDMEDPEELADGTMQIQLTGLTSRTEYTTTLSAVLDNGIEIKDNVPFTTASFAGRYVWTSTAEKHASTDPVNFKVTVKDASESKYRYAIYIDSDDYFFTNPKSTAKFQEYRIMPLIDDSIGEEIPKEPILYSGEGLEKNSALWKSNETYKVNSVKWNASGMAPHSWKPMETELTPDCVTAKVWSLALGINTTTQTTHRFVKEIGKEPTLLFTNKCIEALDSQNQDSSILINYFLMKNPNVQGGDPYTFTLTRISEN